MPNKVTDTQLGGITGGLRNVEKLKDYIRRCKAEGKTLNEIRSKVMIQPMCIEYLHPIYEDDEIVGLDGAGDLWEFTEEYYNSLA